MLSIVKSISLQGLAFSLGSIIFFIPILKASSAIGNAPSILFTFPFNEIRVMNI